MRPLSRRGRVVALCLLVGGGIALFLAGPFDMVRGEVGRDMSSIGAPAGKRPGIAPVMRGVNFSHEGYGGHDGYLSDRADASLAQLAEMGANAVAILPYAFMSSPHEPGPLSPPTRPGSETDEAVSHAVRTATSLGFTVLLKPHIWIRGSWPGEVRMRTEADWDRFFEAYEEWILHYARMAEDLGVPILSVGVELSTAALEAEDRWIAMAERIRTEYSGALVYSANWGEEAEGLGFWKAFDYIGVSAYYPLDHRRNASDDDLRQGAERMLDRIERIHLAHNRPVLLTEIGFASSRAPWIRPWEGHLSDELDHEDQARSYRAVTAALDSRDWIHGVFWWKWPSDPRRADRRPRGFKPVGKPAQLVLEQWFQQAPTLRPFAAPPTEREAPLPATLLAPPTDRSQ